MKTNKIKWKQNASGNMVAFCGNIKIGWVTKSLSQKNIYTVCLLRDMFDNVNLKSTGLVIKIFSDLEEAKKVLEDSFIEIIDIINKELNGN